ILRRHARPCAGHPRLASLLQQNADGWDISAFTRVFRRAMPGPDDVVTSVSGAGRMQVLVVGAGVVGLAVARAAALAGPDVVVAEAASAMGTGISSRNSEVIHAGLYYPTGSRRAHHCPRGRRLLYDFCASHGVPHLKFGKLVVATNAGEIERLAVVHKQAL